MTICVASALIVARCQPYADPLCGRVQLLALSQLAFTYMSGMLFFDDGGATPLWWEESETRWGVILILVNVLIVYCCRRKAKRDMNNEMQMQIESAVSQYFALT